MSDLSVIFRCGEIDDKYNEKQGFVCKTTIDTKTKIRSQNAEKDQFCIETDLFEYS